MRNYINPIYEDFFMHPPRPEADFVDSLAALVASAEFQALLAHYASEQDQTLIPTAPAEDLDVLAEELALAQITPAELAACCRDQGALLERFTALKATELSAEFSQPAEGGCSCCGGDHDHGHDHSHELGALAAELDDEETLLYASDFLANALEILLLRRSPEALPRFLRALDLHADERYADEVRGLYERARREIAPPTKEN